MWMKPLIRIFLGHYFVKVIVKMENKVWIPGLKAVVPFEIFLEVINAELAKQLMIQIKLFVNF